MSKKTGIQIELNDQEGNPYYDLAINPNRYDGVNGTGLSIGDTLYQNQYIIMAAQKGELKEYPMLGVGIADITNDNDLLEWKRSIREEFAKDGLKVSKLDIDKTTGEMTLIADYQ